MELYIEYVIVDNWIMDYVLLELLEVTFTCKFNKKNKFFSVLFGVVSAIFLPFVLEYKIVSTFYKIMTSIIMVLIAKKYKNIKSFLTYYFLFISYTFLLGGACIGMITIFGIEYTMSSVLIYNLDLPMGVIVLLLFVIIKLAFKFVKCLKNKLSMANFIYSVKITDGDVTLSVPAFLDTGNNVSFADKGVNIMSLNVFFKLYKDIDLHNVLLKRMSSSELKSVEYLEISGLGKGKEYLTFEVDSMCVNGKIYNLPRMALAMKNFGDYECILHKMYVKG